jgi:hypothetical protein
MPDKNFKLSKEAKALISGSGKRDNVFKKLIVEAEEKFQQNKNRKTIRTE